MHIHHGLLPGQVLQRNQHGRGCADVNGACTAAGEVQWRLADTDRGIASHAWLTAGHSDGRYFEVTLADLPTGGPYQVELQIRSNGKTVERTAVDNLFVGDVWILVGQSNMEGVGNLKHAPDPHPMVHAFYMRDEWGVAQEKLHYLAEAVDKVHNSYGNEDGRPSKAELEKGRTALVKGMSPGHAFGLEMYKRTNVPQALIPCAHGGTSMAQWSPALRDRGGTALYGAMMRRYEKLNQPVAGVLWYQGESDANPDCVYEYTNKMVDLIAASRRDMNQPDLPWIIVQLGCHAAPGGEYWNRIQEQQRRLPEAVNNIDVIPAVDLPLDDPIHISGAGHLILAQRLARAAERLVHGKPTAQSGIKLKEMRLKPTPDTNRNCPWMSVELEYDNVAGSLVSTGRPTGFALLNEKGKKVHGIFKTTLHDNCVVLHTSLPKQNLETLGVSYGHGRHPFCNITDSDGMSLPAMNAVLVEPRQEF